MRDKPIGWQRMVLTLPAVLALGFWWGPNIDPVTRARDALEAAQTATGRASDAAAIAISALQNAVAASDELEQVLVAALRSRDEAAIALAREEAAAAADAAQTAIDLTVRTVHAARRAREARDEAVTLAARVESIDNGRQANRTAGKVADLRDTAQDAAEIAEQTARILKTEWLVVSLSPAATPTTTQPAAPSAAEPVQEQ